MTVLAFYNEHVIDGRAVLKWKRDRDDIGKLEPQLWICLIGRTYVACDAEGANKCGSAIDPDGGFLISIHASLDVELVVRLWKSHRTQVLRNRDRARKEARRSWYAA